LSLENSSLCLTRIENAEQKDKYIVINKFIQTNDKDDKCVEDYADEMSVPIIGIISYGDDINKCMKNSEIFHYKSDDEFTKVEDVDNWFNTYNSMTDEALKQAEYDSKKSYIEHATDVASKAAVNTWSENNSRSSWLWIQNIWVADSTSQAFPTFSSLQSMAKSSGYAEYVEANIKQSDYDSIATLISNNTERQNNGLFLLPILAGLITFLSQYISELHTKLKNKKANIVAKTASAEMGSTMKVMKIVLPIIMVVFTLSASASFGMYIVATNLATIAFGELSSLIINVLTRKKQLEVEESLEKEANRLIRKGKLKG
jgi:hypothetical protein